MRFTKGINPELLAVEPAIPWSAIARMSDHLAHRYFDTDHAIVEDVVANELEPLLQAVRAPSGRVGGEDGTSS